MGQFADGNTVKIEHRMTAVRGSDPNNPNAGSRLRMDSYMSGSCSYPLSTPAGDHLVKPYDFRELIVQLNPRAGEFR